MARVAGEPARLWGNIVGFGQYHYRDESGCEGDGATAAFAPRKAATSIYVPDGVGAHENLLEHLGPHMTGVGCICMKDLEAVDMAVLEDIIARSYASLTAHVHPARPRGRQRLTFANRVYPANSSSSSVQEWGGSASSIPSPASRTTSVMGWTALGASTVLRANGSSCHRR